MKSVRSHGSHTAEVTSVTDNITFANVALYKGGLVSLKKINNPSVQLDRKALLEIKQVKEMHHDNLNAFIGACIDPPNVCVICAYCSRGSLQVSTTHYVQCS